MAPTTLVNRGADARNLTGAADPAPTPQWRQISDSSTYLYHDHRIDWMGGGLPAVVRNDINHSHLVKRWEIDLMVDDTAVNVLGTLIWKPTGFSLLDIAFVAICCLIILVVACVMIVERRRDKALLAKLG